jgi:hypothetical protein
MNGTMSGSGKRHLAEPNHTDETRPTFIINRALDCGVNPGWIYGWCLSPQRGKGPDRHSMPPMTLAIGATRAPRRGGGRWKVAKAFSRRKSGDGRMLTGVVYATHCRATSGSSSAGRTVRPSPAIRSARRRRTDQIAGEGRTVRPADDDPDVARHVTDDDLALRVPLLQEYARV